MPEQPDQPEAEGGDAFAQPVAATAADSVDLYACLNVSRDASLAEITSAYRRLSRVVHPDKQSPASPAGGESASASASAAYERVRRAYDVLKEAETRQVYDEFGMAGVRALGESALAVRQRTAAELRAELQRLRRLKDEERVMSLTQPASRLSIGLDVSALFPDAGGRPREELALYIANMSFSQTTSFQLAPRQRLVLAGSLAKVGRGFGPSATLSLRSQLADSLSTELTAGLAFLPMAAGKATWRCCSGRLLLACKAEAALSQRGGVAFVLTPSATCQLAANCVASLSCSLNSPTRGARAELLCQVSESLHTKLGVFVDPEDAGAKLSATWTPAAGFGLGCGLRLCANELWRLHLSASHQVSEFSRAAIRLRFGPETGVGLKLTLVRANQTYCLPVTLADFASPPAIVYGTAVPLLAYCLLYRYAYRPWLHRFQRESQEQQQEQQEQERSSRRAEAAAARSLMRESAANSRRLERQRGGLVIDRALYGHLAGVADSDDDDNNDDNNNNGGGDSVIDVADCLQIMVEASKLEIAASVSKSHLPGFCEPPPPPAAAAQPRSLFIRYTFAGQRHRLLATDSDAVRIPQRRHLVQRS